MNSFKTVSFKHLVLFFLSLLCLSQAATLVRLANTQPEVIGFWRLLGAGLILMPFAYHHHAYKPLKTSSTKEWFWILLSGVFFFAHLWTYFYAAHNTRIAHCMIIFSTNPLFTAIGARLFFNEKLNWKLGVSYALAIAGLLQLFSGDSWDLSLKPESLYGDLASLFSAILYSGYLLTGRRVRSKFSNLAYASLIYLTASICFLGMGVGRQIDFFNHPAITWWAILGTIVFPTLLGHAIFTYLLKEMNINLMSCGKLIEPVLSSIAAWLLFNEELKNHTFIAFAFTASSILIMFVPWKVPFRKKAPQPNLEI
jgi:drug/metabolite transporter (DMT)-like permease